MTLRPALFALLLTCLLPGAAAAAESDWIKIEQRQEGDSIRLAAQNSNPWAPVHLEINYPGLDNLRPTVAEPARFVLQPNEKRDLISFTPVDRGRGSSLRTSARYGQGDPGAVPSPDELYVFPWAHGKKHEVVQGYFGGYTHIDERALDFDLEEGELIHAARSGRVIGLKKDSDRGGESSLFSQDANYVDVLHSDGTWATYAHLQYNGTLVDLGQWIKAGDPVGKAGHTGQARGPHLHFVVRKALWGGGTETVATRFAGPPSYDSARNATLTATPMEPQEGESFYSYHPGGEPFTEVRATDRSPEDLEAWDAPAKADGRISTRQETVDKRVFIYVRNGKSGPRKVQIRFRTLDNYTPSKPLPVTKVVPAGREVFFLWLDRNSPRDSRYQLEYGWQEPRD